VTWDGGGANNIWTNGLNWSDDSAPTGGNDYVVDGAEITSPGDVDPTSTVTYTFGGDSLSVTNGSTLLLSKQNPGGTDKVTLNITNLVVEDSTIEVQSGRNYDLYLDDNLHLAGTCDIFLSTGSYARRFYLRGGMTGSGSVYLHRPLDGGTRALTLVSGNFSGYAGDWTIENTDDSAAMELRCNTVSGWGSGDVTLRRGGTLDLNAAITAPGSTIVMGHSAATLDLGSDVHSVLALVIGGHTVPAGTYSAGDLANLGYGGTFLGGGSITTTFTPTNITWDGDGADDAWTNSLNWSDDQAPRLPYSYVVDGAVVQDPGGTQDWQPVTYTFGGGSLTVTNGGTLYLRKSNSGGNDYVYEYISGLTIADSTIKHKSASKISRHFMEYPITCIGDSTVYFEGGTYGSHLTFEDGLTGSGSLRVYRSAIGHPGDGPTANNSTRLRLNGGDYSGYSGNWTVESTAAGETIYLLVNTTSGWGSGNMTLGVSAYLGLNAAVTAGGSDLSMDTSATLDLGTEAHAVDYLRIGGHRIGRGTYTAGQLAALGHGGTFTGVGTITATRAAPATFFIVR